MKINYALFPYVIISIVGCSASPPKTDAINQFIETTTYSYCKPEFENCSKINNPYYLTEYNSAQEPKKKEIRNRIISEQMRFVDEEFRAYEKILGTNVDYKNFAVHIVSVGLSSAATLVGGASTKAIISAIDTGLKTTSSNFDSDVLHNKALNILKNQMYKDRAVESQIIKGKMKKNCSEYQLEEAIRDLTEYRNVGQFDRALTNLENQTGAAANKQELTDAKIIPGTTEAEDNANKLVPVSGGEGTNGNKTGVVASVANSAGTASGAPAVAVNAGISAAAISTSNGSTPAQTGEAVTDAMINNGADPTAAKTTGDAVSGAATALTPP